MSHFIDNYIKKPPLLFPLVAVFHLFITLHAVWTYSDVAFSFTDWMYPLSLFVYSVFWVFVCGMKKWAAYAYILFTIFNLLLRFFIAPAMKWPEYDAALFPADVVFGFFILIYFRRFE